MAVQEDGNAVAGVFRSITPVMFMPEAVPKAKIEKDRRQRDSRKYQKKPT